METSAQELLWTGIWGMDATEVSSPRPGGIVLFGRNLDPDPACGPERCHALIRGLQTRWEDLAVALDQEGGPVSRLKVWVGDTPSIHRIWEAGGAEACARWGRLWGRGLALLGFNVDFAPVADLWDGNLGTGMGDRCASRDHREVVRAAGAFLHGLESMGIRGCLKHFPGLGGTHVDSHKSLPKLEDEVQIQRNLEPFRSLCHMDRLVMVAHLKTPHTAGMPASLHRGSVEENPLGIRGRWIPDDLEMGGCADWGWDERVRLCLDAGHVALLVCQTREGIHACGEALSRVDGCRIAPALERYRSLRRNLRPPLPTHFDHEAWKVWLEEIRTESIRM